MERKAKLTYLKWNIQFHREPTNSYVALLTYLSQANLILQQFVTLSHSYLARFRYMKVEFSAVLRATLSK